MLIRPFARAVLSLAATGVIVVAGAASAWAHVEVDSAGAHPGARDVTVTFHVPNELAPAVTTVITFMLPTDHPLIGVTALPQHGFVPQLTTTQLASPVAGPDGPVTEAVSQVTFSGGRIEREDDLPFELHVAQLPVDATQLTFTALQTYDDGTVVSWSDLAPEGAAEPEHPAPVLELGPAGAAVTEPSPQPVAVTATPATPAAPAARASGAVAATSSAASPVTSALVVGGGLVLLGAGIALYLRRTRVEELDDVDGDDAVGTRAGAPERVSP